MSRCVHYLDLIGRRAVVTGSSSGVGAGITLALLRQGVHVYGLSLDGGGTPYDAIYGTPAHAAPGVTPGSLIPLQCDLTDSGAIDAVAGAIRASTPTLDFIVNCAGIDPKYSMESGDAAAFDRVMDTNLRAPYLLIRSCLPMLRSGSGKSIVNISSINYRLGVPNRAIYSASKAGMLGLTTNLARSLGKEGIRVNTVTPGWVWTPRERKEYFEDPQHGARFEEYLMGKQSSSHKITPDDVAAHVLFYLSGASAASTGHNCVVDAGWLLE